MKIIYSAKTHSTGKYRLIAYVPGYMRHDPPTFIDYPQAELLADLLRHYDAIDRDELTRRVNCCEAFKIEIDTLHSIPYKLTNDD